MTIPKIIDEELNLFIRDCCRTNKIPGVPINDLDNIIPITADDDLDPTEDGKPTKILLVEFNRKEGSVTYHTRKSRLKVSNFESVNGGFGKYEVVSYSSTMERTSWPGKKELLRSTV